ncbi:MAG: aldo/keto reductase [Acidobacteria bacterium]|nr:MAG: aldo/keto reductase [Acidobacteriota bacterium]
MKSKLSRRSFLQHSAAGLGAIGTLSNSMSGAPAMPKRPLGKTGLDVSILSFGGGSNFLKNKDGVWEAMIEKSIQAGINLFDTATQYKWQSSKSSEERFGDILPQYRKSIILSTKIDNRDVSKGMAEFEGAMKRLKVDYLDILMLHSIEKSEDIAALEQGIWKEFIRLKEAKTVRFIGFSSMNSAEKSKEMIEKLPVDVCILALNATKYGNFGKVALPVAREKNVGVIAMKVIKGVEESAPVPELLKYVWSQPGVATAVIGHVGMQNLEENIQQACAFTTKMTRRECEALEAQVAHLAGPHALPWARPGYRDGMMV